tara:strand:+ start:1218 stop:1568 length:351 start_codon:yes stop_codon:yes gene_type:complete
MEKDIDKIPKNPETDIVIRIDDFGGKTGLTIREFVKSDRYTGFTKSGTRISAEHFKKFKDAINSIDEKDLEASQAEAKKEDLGYNPDSEPKEETPKEDSEKTTEQSQNHGAEEQAM